MFYFGSTRNLKLRFIQQKKSLKILFNRVNPLRAGLVERPEQYRWNSLGYHVQTNNRDNFLSTDFGLKEFNPPPADKCLKSQKERIRRYRRFVYEAGS
jgi:putative transposase